MRAALAAYRFMVEVARAHGGIDASEAALLTAYRRALGLSDADVRDAAVDHEPLVTGDEREREETILALARVAHADGRLAGAERDRILEVAGRLGIGRVRSANLLNVAEREQRTYALDGRHAKHRRTVLVASLLVVASAVTLWLQARAGAAHVTDLGRVAERCDSALVLLHVHYELVRGDRRLSAEGEGTGFFLGADGLVVTCKHVVEPWKFLGDRVQMLDDGWSVDHGATRVTAWRPGARVLSDAGLDRSDAWDTQEGTLALVSKAPDHWVKGSRPLSDGGRHFGRYHKMDDNDLALLRVLDGCPGGLELAAAEYVPRPLEPIVVLGFPKGIELLEGKQAVSSPSPGAVRKVEETILVNADIFPGNSGGPCVDAQGRVLGVAARRVGDESLGRCIRAKHVHALLRAKR